MEQSTASTSSTGTATILLVDDQPANLLALEAILEPLGHRLVRANSGEEALRVVLREDVAVVLLDVQMPGLDGFETAAILKSRPRTKHLPIIFITALSRDATNIFKGYETGAVDYILKPLNPDILRSKVGVFIELYLRGQEIERQAALLRQREQEALERRSEQRFRALTDAIPTCVWAMRPDGTVYYANRVWRRYFGGFPERGFDEWANVHAEDVAEVRTRWNESLREATHFERQFRLRCAFDGNYRWMLGRAVPVHGEEGEITGWIASAADIDDQKRAEEILTQVTHREQAARQAAETANRSKDEFLATISHELRTPLTSILGWAAVLRAGTAPSEKIQHAAGIIERNARAQRSLIEDLLDMSRVMSGKLKLQITRVDPKAVVLSAIESVRSAADAKNIELRMNPDNVPASIQADPDRLQQVIWNLVANAVKFSPSGAKVDIDLERRSDNVVISVSDNGPGLSTESLKHVFERFWQADGTSTRIAGGLGLGLAIVRHLVELHGGRVEAHSDGPGHGATFSITLPCGSIACEPVPPPVEMPATPDATVLRDVSVLLVEDDPDGREAISMMLEEYGATVVAVGSASEAMAILRSSHPDVLLSDIGLPQEDGYSLLRRIRALREDEGGHIPAAALSAYAGSDDKRRSLDAGFQVHIAKPVEPHRLAAAIERLAHPTH